METLEKQLLNEMFYNKKHFKSDFSQVENEMGELLCTNGNFDKLTVKTFFELLTRFNSDKDQKECNYCMNYACCCDEEEEKIKDQK